MFADLTKELEFYQPDLRAAAETTRATLPHIAFSRDTLPWERTAKSESDEPWLALLLFNQDEAAECPLKTMTLKGTKTSLRRIPLRSL